MRVILYTIIMFDRSYWTMIVMLFLVGFSENFTLSIGYNYFVELIGEPYRPTYGSLWNANEGLVYLWATIWFGAISKDWFPFISIGYVINILSCITTYYWPESPAWLVNRKEYEEADKVWEYIAKWNGTSYSLDKNFFATTLQSPTKKDSDKG